MANPAGTFIWYDLMTTAPDRVAPFYAAVAGGTIGGAIEAHGGAVVMGPHVVPTGEWIVTASDPAGAGFGFTGPKGE